MYTGFDSCTCLLIRAQKLLEVGLNGLQLLIPMLLGGYLILEIP